MLIRFSSNKLALMNLGKPKRQKIKSSTKSRKPYIIPMRLKSNRRRGSSKNSSTERKKSAEFMMKIMKRSENNMKKSKRRAKDRQKSRLNLKRRTMRRILKFQKKQITRPKIKSQLKRKYFRSRKDPWNRKSIDSSIPFKILKKLNRNMSRISRGSSHRQSKQKREKRLSEIRSPESMSLRKRLRNCKSLSLCWIIRLNN